MKKLTIYFLIFFNTLSSFNAIPSVVLTNKITIVDRVMVVKHIPGMECKRALSNIAEEKNINKNFIKGESYWIFFEIVNSSIFNFLRLLDAENNLDGIVKEFFVIDSVPEEYEEVSKNGDNKFNFELKLPKGEKRILALRIDILKRDFKINFFFYPKTNSFLIDIFGKDIVVLMTMLAMLFMLLTLVLLFISGFLSKMSKLVYFLFLEGIFFVLPSLLCSNILSSRYIFIFMILLFSSRYTCLIFVTFNLIKPRKRSIYKAVMVSLGIFLWIFTIPTLIGVSSTSSIYRILHLISALIVLTVTLVSSYTYFKYEKKRDLVLGIAFFFLFFLKLEKFMGMLGTKLDLNIPVNLALMFQTAPIVILVIVYKMKISKERSLEIAMLKNSDVAFNALRDESNLRDVISKFIFESRKYMNFESAHIFLKEEGALHFYTSIPSMASVASSRILQFLSNIDNDRTYLSDNLKAEGNLDLGLSKYYSSILSLPLDIDNKFIGNIVFVSSEYYAFSNNAVVLGRELALKSSIIIKNYRQMELIKMYDKKAQFEEIIKMFQRNTTHDIKAPLRGIKTALNVIKRKYVEDSVLIPYLDHMEVAVDSAMEQVRESISMMAEVSEDFDIEYLSEELLDLKKLAELENVIIDEKINVSRRLNGPKKSIRNMLRSIVKNSIEALDVVEREHKQIDIRYFLDEKNRLTITVRDNGIGIKEANKDKFGQQFSFGKKEGSGHGLLVAKYIVDNLDGELTVDSVENEYTIVTIKIAV